MRSGYEYYTSKCDPWRNCGDFEQLPRSHLDIDGERVVNNVLCGVDCIAVVTHHDASVIEEDVEPTKLLLQEKS